jgi:serine/threonine-protein kinase
MELLEGEDLGARLHREPRMKTEVALHVAAQVLVALGTAHEAGVVHRDLKPDNVFLTKRDGDAAFTKLLDFGMSKLTPREGQTLALALTKKGMAVGTPFYMAPEQARALDDVDGRADLWSVGAILFECLAGRPPFIGPVQEQVLIAICTTDAPDVRALQPSVPSKVAKLIARALARDRAQRFLSAWEMLGAIAEVAPDEGRLIPEKARTAVDVAVIAPPTSAASESAPGLRPATPRMPSSPDRSGPVSAPAGASGRFGTILAAPIPGLADGSGPIAMPPRAPRVRRAPPQPKRMRVVILALCAVILGVGVAVYVLAMTRAR